MMPGISGWLSKKLLERLGVGPLVDHEDLAVATGERVPGRAGRLAGSGDALHQVGVAVGELLQLGRVGRHPQDHEDGHGRPPGEQWCPSELRTSRTNRSPVPAVPDGREHPVAEVVGALSLATDLAVGARLESALSVCVLATRLARRLDLPADEQVRTYYLAMLRHIGCTAGSQDFAGLVGDEIEFRCRRAPGELAGRLRGGRAPRGPARVRRRPAPRHRRGVDMGRIAGGKAVEHWAGPDFLGLFQQLGTYPPAR
jgi:hypothetical protein